MINKSTQSILHGLTNGTDGERRPEEDDLGIDDGRVRRFPSLSPNTSIRSKYRAFSSAVGTLEKDKRPPDDDRLRCSPDGAPTPAGKRGRRKDEFEHVICQQAEAKESLRFFTYGHGGCGGYHDGSMKKNGDVVEPHRQIFPRLKCRDACIGD